MKDLNELCKSLKKSDCSLTTINISRYYRHEPIGDEGVKLIADALKKNTSLQFMKIWGFKISDKGAKYLAKAINSIPQFLVLDFFKRPIHKACKQS